MNTEQKPPNAGMGRPKGSLNKTTRAAKEAIAFAAEEVGGAERLAAWVKEDPANERAFWTIIYLKLLPLTIGGDPANPIKVGLIELIDLDGPSANKTAEEA